MFDTHCHIDEEAFVADREEVIARQHAAGVEAMIVPGVNVASIDTVLEVCHQHPGYCFPALGLHPEDVKADWQTALETVEKAIRDHRSELVAIGEIGLDYYWDKTYKAEQQEVLRRQLLLARELDLPVILHNREATEDIVRLVHEAANYKLQITNYKLKPLRGVFHCFNGSKETAQQILEMGFYIGFDGPLTFKNNKKTPGVLEICPWDRIVVETDSPYLAPEPNRGMTNEPAFVTLVVEKIAQLKGVDPAEAVRITSENGRRLFRI